MHGRILVVDDDQTACEFAAQVLQGRDLAVEWRTRAHDALSLMAEEDFDMVLTDIHMVDLSGLELCERILHIRPSMPVVVMTGQATVEMAIAAMRVGAYDFVTKPLDAKLLCLTIWRAIRHHRLQQEVRRLQTVIDGEKGIADLVGHSPSMRGLFDIVKRVADSEASVLITGESGTGKELVARAVHQQSNRCNGPFLAINCAAMPANLLETELFGHVRGAFTDAKSSRLGLFVQADGGTLFLDEMGELPLEMQPKLLRALQERTVRPLGGNSETPFNARIVAATNRDLDSEVEAGRFRADLFYRINVVRLELPPLRHRGSDILLLAQMFLQRFSERSHKSDMRIALSAAERLLAYHWPGNVRELENCIERAVALARFDELTVEDLPEKIRSYRADRLIISSEDPTSLVTVEELERRYIMQVLSMVGGNKSKAAQILGLDRRTLYRKIQQYERKV